MLLENIQGVSCGFRYQIFTSYNFTKIQFVENVFIVAEKKLNRQRRLERTGTN